jgi:hypothetical protein
MKDQKTRFETIGWFSNGEVVENANIADENCINTLIELINNSPIYVWAGDDSSVGEEYLATCSEVDETQNHFIAVNEQTSFHKNSGRCCNYHWNRLSLIRGADGCVFVFPHSLMYRVFDGKAVISERFRQAIENADFVTYHELVADEYHSDYDEHGFEEVWFEAEKPEHTSAESEIAELWDRTMPTQYAGDYKKTEVRAQSWVNFGSQKSDGKYSGQQFCLPSPVDKENLRALLGRQHLPHLALAFMSKGYALVSQLCDSDPVLARQILVLFLNYRKYQAFTEFVVQQEGEFDEQLGEFCISFPDKLKSLAPSYFPFTQ